MRRAAVKIVLPAALAYTQKLMLNRGYAYTTTIAGRHAGQSVLAHVASLYPHTSRGVWQQKLADGELTLDGIVAGGSETLRAGATLVWNRPPWVEPEAPRRFDVLFEDEHLVAVNKPSGLPTLPGAGFLENTLLRLVQRRTPEANPVHRLGRATSGIVLFAKTARVASVLGERWNTPGVRKIYRALAQGAAELEAYDIAAPIGLVPHPLLGSVWGSHPGGKASRSVARVVARIADTTLFEVSLYSGRPHQIRIHLASIGHALVGEPLYGAAGQVLGGLPGDGGYLLHAHLLRFEHPVNAERVELEAPLPAGLSKTLGQPL